MRYNNIELVVALFTDNEGHQLRIAKTGKNYYVIIQHKNNLNTYKFNSEEIAKKFMINKVKSLCDSMVKLGIWTPANANMIYKMKEQIIKEFKYDTSTGQ